MRAKDKTSPLRVQFIHERKNNMRAKDKTSPLRVQFIHEKKNMGRRTRPHHYAFNLFTKEKKIWGRRTRPRHYAFNLFTKEKKYEGEGQDLTITRSIYSRKKKKSVKWRCIWRQTKTCGDYVGPTWPALLSSAVHPVCWLNMLQIHWRSQAFGAWGE